MPEPTSMQILDTVIKVGLGALVTGVVSYLISEKNRQHDVEKTKWESRKYILLEATNSAQQYFSSASKLLAALDGVSKDIESNGQPYSDYKKFLKVKDESYVDATGDLERCYALLLILVGDNSEASKKIWEYQEEVSSLRKSVFRSSAGLNIPTQHEISRYRENLSNLRKDFYCSLRKNVGLNNA
ncbi:hypothetical protein EAG18_18375 [Pseudoalteromonas sp. J010]|uniref:hypothetical protein n=1 Tax=Pseudoalteromonas sp. J010 TaxID=998465 RepID=UPI000F64C9EB|nr:hypothetical protein [Pseudoalteromonas sp. J010]RRS07222.1 hypothetical protein EAG18_18375 [Pseudoalteromonas sp. J010]